MHTYNSFLGMLIYSGSSHKDTRHVYRLSCVNNIQRESDNYSCSRPLLYIWTGCLTCYLI